MTVCVDDALTMTIDRHHGTFPDRHDGDGDGAQERQWNATVRAFRSTVTVITERSDGDGDGPPPSPSWTERPARTLMTHRSNEGKNVPMTVINDQARTVTVTGGDQLSVIDELRSWLAARTETVMLVSLTLTGNSWNAEVHAVAVVTERAQRAACSLPISASGHVANFYRDQVAAQIAAGTLPVYVSAAQAARYAVEMGVPCSRQAAAKKIRQLTHDSNSPERA